MSHLDCKHISRLDFILARSVSPDRSLRCVPSWTEVVDDLYLACEAIQTINLDIINDRTAFDIRFLYRLDPIKTLRHFTRLRELFIPQDALLPREYGRSGHEHFNFAAMFPPSLELVTIAYCDNTLLEWLRDLLAAKSWGAHSIVKTTLLWRASWSTAQDKLLETVAHSDVVVALSLHRRSITKRKKTLGRAKATCPENVSLSGSAGCFGADGRWKRCAHNAAKAFRVPEG